MVKKLFIFLIFCFTLFSVNSVQFVYQDDINDLLNDLSLSEVIYNITLNLQQNNFTQNYTLITKDNLKIIFTSQKYSNETEVDSNILGQYDFELNEIEIYLESIYNIYPNLNDFKQKIHNTLMHEITHYMEEKELLSDLYETYNIQGQYPHISNINYFQELYENETELPLVLKNTLNPQIITDYYSGNYWSREIISRYTAICFIEDENYTNYWEMYILSNYTICSNFDFPVYYDNNINEVAKQIIESYIIKEYEFQIPTYTSSVNMIEEVGQGTGNFLSVIISPLLYLILPLTLIGIILSIFKFIIPRN